MIFKMTAPIKFELSPRGNSNSLKFAHEQFFIYQVVTRTGLIATGYFCQPVYGTIASNLIITPSITSIQYKGERDKRYLPYIELGRWFCSDFQLETPA